MEKKKLWDSQNCSGTECDSDGSHCQSRVLTCFPSASGWWSSLVYRHRRCPLLYTKGLSPQPLHPGWCQQCLYHLERKKKKRQSMRSWIWGVSCHMWKGKLNTYKLPSSAVHIQRTQPHSWLCSSTLPHPPSWLHWISEDDKLQWFRLSNHFA